MKQLILVPIPKPPAPDFVAEFPNDIARLVAVASAAGYAVSPQAAAGLWSRYSESLCASWMSMATWDDATVLECLLTDAVVVDSDDGAPALPTGYHSWLDYAADTLDFPVTAAGAQAADGLSKATSIARDTARGELEALRKLAHLQRR